MSNSTAEGSYPADTNRQTAVPDAVVPPAETSGNAIVSSQLLDGRSSVTINHLGVAYILRATRAGKLILTK